MKVAWLNLNPQAQARGSWDQQIIEDLTVGAEHLVIDAYNYDLGRLEEGAVVVIPGQHNRYDDQPARISRFIARLPWALTIITSDEEALYPLDPPIEALPDDDDHAIFTQYHDRGKDVVLPIGAGPGLPTLPVSAVPRPLDVVFLGQVTHSRREELVEVMEGHGSRWQVEMTAGFRHGYDRRTYRNRLTLAKIAPAPSGLHSLDSFRLWEALDAGCVPIIETCTPDGPEPDFWAALLGLHHPIPTVTSWTELDDLVPELLADWEQRAHDLQVWYADFKAETRVEFNTYVDALSVA